MGCMQRTLALALKRHWFGSAMHASSLGADMHGNAWQPVDGRMQRLAVGSQEYVWGLDANGRLNRFSGNRWTLVDNQTTMADIAGGPDGSLWALDNDHRVWKFKGQGPTFWLEMPGKMTEIAVGSAKVVYALDQPGTIYRWNGTLWDVLPGNLAQISAASDGTVWGTDGEGRIYSGR